MQAFDNEAVVQVGDTRLRLVLNFRAIDATEGLTGLTMPNIVRLMLKGDPPLALGAKVLWGMLREHHAELTLDEIMQLTFGEHNEAIGVAMGDLWERSGLVQIERPEPQKKRAVRPRGASKTSSPSGLPRKRAASKASGGKPRPRSSSQLKAAP